MGGLDRLLALVVAALCLPALASASPTHNPELTALVNGVSDAAHEAPLRLRRLTISIDVHGAVAEAVVDATFLNPGPDMLEGDFRYALPEGAVVTGYALDVDGAMIDGSLVDRPRAKAIFDARVRRGVDPGLAEVVAGNVFETHVHPIFPGNGRRIRLRFVMPVPVAGLRLPLAIDRPLDGWSITVRSADTASPPAVTFPDGNKARFDRDGESFIASAEGKDGAVAGDISIARPGVPAVIVNRHGGGEYDVQLSGNLSQMSATAKAPGRLRIYWDRSRARLASHLADDIELVREVIARTQPAAIELVAFNSSGAQRQTVADADEAATWLKTLTYRGAASYVAIAADPATPRCLLFANGHPTLDLGTAFVPACRLDAVTSAPGVDTAWLRHIAQSHGGTAHRLAAGKAAALAQVLSENFAGVVALHDRDGRSLPFVPLDAAPGQWVILARAPEAGPVTVELAGGAVRQEVRLLPVDGTDFDGPGALLAADRLADLTAPAQREDYVALSRRYGLASASLSFLVLESPQDYIVAKIEPPATFPSEWRNDYWRQRKASEANRSQVMADHLEQIVGQWQEQVTWWKTRFDPAAMPKRTVTSDHFDRTQAAGRNAAPDNHPTPGLAPPAIMSAPVAPPPPPPPASAPPAPERPAAGNSAAPDGDIVVTSMRITRRHGASAPAPESQDTDSDVGTTTDDSQAPHIVIDAWQPDRPYLELFDGKPADFDARFVEAEARHGTLPIFYLDTAEWLRKRGRAEAATEMVLSALELPSANEVTLGIVADRLERYGAIDRAVELRERAVMLDPDRPQPRRLLALALGHRAMLEPAHARQDLARAIALLYDIAVTPQNGEWNGIELIALDEANAMLPRLRKLGGRVDMDPRLIALLDVDLRVVIDWTSDGSDMDLWIDEPDHERAIYNNPRTAIGGRLSHDMTRGYGPEEYMLHRAPAGVYAVQANVFAPDRLDPNGATILTAHLFRNYGRPTEHEESVDVELKRDEKGAKMIGEINVAGDTK